MSVFLNTLVAGLRPMGDTLFLVWTQWIVGTGRRPDSGYELRWGGAIEGLTASGASVDGSSSRRTNQLTENVCPE